MAVIHAERGIGIAESVRKMAGEDAIRGSAPLTLGS